MDANRIAVIGADTMGSGIAQVFAGSGIEVLLTDINDAAVQRGVATVSKDVIRDYADFQSIRKREQ